MLYPTPASCVPPLPRRLVSDGLGDVSGALEGHRMEDNKHSVFMKTRQLYQSNDISLQFCLCISFKKEYMPNQ